MKQILLLVLLAFLLFVPSTEAYEGQLFKSEYYFQAKIPNGWKTIEIPDKALRIEQNKKFIEVKTVPNIEQYEFEKFSKDKFNRLTDYLSENLSELYPGYEVNRSGEVTINKHRFIWFSASDSLGKPLTIYCASGKNYLYQIAMNDGPKSEQFKEFINNFFIDI